MRRILGFILIFVLSACLWSPSDRPTITLRGPDDQFVNVNVELADTPEERTQGLMFREDLPEGEGMLFVFETERPLSFWMKNTLIPLDILFFDATGEWVSSATMTPCTMDPCGRYPSAGPAKFALEVPFGFIEEYGVGAGWGLQGIP